ncbi:MAG: hypothetical protein R2939_08425 [Kofleriaceae bacterium]
MKKTSLVIASLVLAVGACKKKEAEPTPLPVAGFGGGGSAMAGSAVAAHDGGLGG